MGGGGGQRVCWPPSQIIGGPGLSLPTPMHSSLTFYYCFISRRKCRNKFFIKTETTKPNKLMKKKQ